MQKDLGFLKTLMDFSFTSFVTTKIVKFVYILAIIMAAVGSIAAIGSGFSESVATGILAIILSPLMFALSVLVARIWLEIIIVVFRIAETLKQIANQK